jgi:hypothetical protein
MMALHNFHLKRSNGTTAAQCLFGHPTPDLFELLIQQMPDLLQARRRKPAPKTKLWQSLLLIAPHDSFASITPCKVIFLLEKDLKVPVGVLL